MDVATTIKKFGLEQAFDYLYKDPEKNLRKLMDWADKFSGGEFAPQRKAIREAITNPEHPYYSYVRRLVTEVDSNVMCPLPMSTLNVVLGIDSTTTPSTSIISDFAKPYPSWSG